MKILRSPFLEIAVGAVGGFLTGFVIQKASKLVALFSGGSILLFELAFQAGIFEFESDSIELRYEPGTTQAQGQLRIAGPTHQLQVTASIGQLGENNRKPGETSQRLCVAFLGGFLLGFGSA